MQTKEKLISSLQAGSDGASGHAQEAAQEQFQLQKEAIEMELETARLQGVQLREELQETEEQHSQEMEQLTEQVSNSLQEGACQFQYLCMYCVVVSGE